jgi:hypothetical protein
VCEVDRRRHERALLVDLALGAGVAEHHALVAGAFLFLALLLLGVDAHGDVGRLAVQQHLDVGAVIREAVLVVADVLDHTAGDLGDLLAVDHRHPVNHLEQLAAAFARHHDLVGGAKGFAAEPGVDLAVVGDAEFHILLEERIENGIGNLVGDLVRMAFGYGFTGEQEVGSGHVQSPEMAAGMGPPVQSWHLFAASGNAVKMWDGVGKRSGRVRRA